MFSYDDNRVIYTFSYDVIYKEVTKRTSFLGKNRGTEQLMHRLDQMSFTKDEEFIFVPYIRNAAALIFEPIMPICKGIERAYRYNLDFITKIHRVLDDPSDIFTFTAGTITATTPSTNHRTITAPITISMSSTPDLTTYTLNYKVRVKYDVSNLETVETRFFEKTGTIIGIVPQTLSISDTIFVAESVGGVQLEQYVGNESAEIELWYTYKTPTTFDVGNYVEYGDDVYKCIAACDENVSVDDIMYFEKLTIDDRGCVIYETHNYDWLDNNAFPIIHNYIFEAFINYIMYRWFMTVAPEESANFKGLFDESIINLKNSIQTSGEDKYGRLRRRYKYY